MSGLFGPVVSKYIAEQRRLLGLEDPNPGGGRWLGRPAVMASAPSLTLSAANAAENISPNTFWPSQANAFSNASGAIDTGRFRWLGCKPEVRVTYPYGVDVNGMVSVVDVSETLPQRVEFMTDAPKINLETWGTGSYYRVQVDGQWVTQALSAQIPSDGAQYYVTLDFSAVRQPRRILVEGQSSFLFNGVTLDRASVLWRPDHVPSTPRVIVAGDSWAEGTGATYQGFVATLGELLWYGGDVWPSAGGGTGYLNDDSAHRKTLRARITTDITNNSPSVVIVAMGQNDTGSSAAAVQAEAALAWAQLRSENPNAKLVCVGPWSPSGSPNAAKMQTRDAIFAGANSYADLLVDPLGASGGPRSNGTYLRGDTLPAVYDGTAAHYVNLGWITGTGKVGSTTGAGNADVLIGSDGAHPSQAGHDYVAFRLAAAISSAMPF